MKEEWRKIVVEGKEHLWYSVSNFGNTRTHIAPGKKYNPNSNYSKDLKPAKLKNSDGSISKCRVSLQFPDDFFEDYQYRKKEDTISATKTCSVHQLVMETFRPMDDYPPDRLKDCWDDIPEDAKTWIKETVTINHKDHNPENNHVDNLEYTTQRGNSRAAVNHYGGNVANKSKQEKECIIFNEPTYNYLLQEYEDGTVEFVGDEGERVYCMLEEINKERGDESMEDTFWGIIREYDQMMKAEEQ